VLHAEYRAIDTEKDLEDAVAAAPELLFGHEVTLVARQHTIWTSERERDIVDLVFWDETARQLILVELKRGVLETAHEAQLQRYLAHARQSPLLKHYMRGGAQLRGILATVTPCVLEVAGASHIAVHIIDRDRAIQELGRLRRERLK
jgi:RecB family endonuclease NucS